MIAKIKRFIEWVGDIFEGPPNEERQEMKINPAMLGRPRESFWDDGKD